MSDQAHATHLTEAEIAALEVGRTLAPRCYYSHDGDGVSAVTITQSWIGTGSVMWRSKAVVHDGDMSWVSLTRILSMANYPGDVLDLADLPRGHWIDTRITDLASEICASTVAVWCNDCSPGPGVLLKGYDGRGRINLIAMGSRDRGAADGVSS